VRPKFEKKVAYRGLVPMKFDKKALEVEMAWNIQVYLGRGGYVLKFPVGRGALMNVVAFHSS